MAWTPQTSRSDMPAPNILRRRKSLRARNAKRKAAEFARAFYSDGRVRFVRSLPCIACLKFGEIENAHIEGGGALRRADYTKIVPMCRTCHRRMHRIGIDTFLACWNLTRDDLPMLAEETERNWQRRQSQVTP